MSLKMMLSTIYIKLSTWFYLKETTNLMFTFLKKLTNKLRVYSYFLQIVSIHYWISENPTASKEVVLLWITTRIFEKLDIDIGYS